MRTNQLQGISKVRKSGWIRSNAVYAYLKLYIEFFCGWRCRLYGDLFYYGSSTFRWL